MKIKSYENKNYENKNYENKNYKNKKLWVIQKFFYLQKIKTKSFFFVLLQNYFVTIIRCHG
jgi:hypothetical protein